MPPRHTYWTIILEGKPTAFRAHTPDELLPTLRQLQARHPDAVLRWFARGRLWHSQEEERAALAARRSADRERRGRDWRPGGEHRDPRDRFKVPRDEKRRRFRDRLFRERIEPGASRPPGEQDKGARPRGPRARPGWKPGFAKPRGPGGHRGRSDRPPGRNPEGRRGGRKPPGGGRKGGGGGGRSR
jgi:hypothetical protein